MHQPITIAKVRKETKITVPKGGWMLLVSPDEPFSAHAAKRNELAADAPVNDLYETVAVGRMDNKYSDLRFLTAAERKATEATAKENDEAFSKAREEAAKRLADMNATELEKQKADHAMRLAEINRHNDAIRTQQTK